MMSRTLIIAMFVAMISDFSIAKQDESEIIEEVQDVYEDLEYLSAEFIQQDEFKLTGSVNETRGKIYIKDGVQYRLVTEDQTIVTDGKIVWSYSQHSNKVIIDYVKEGDASLLPRDMLFKYPKNYYATLLDEEKYEDNSFYVLKMTPKTEVYGYIQSMKIYVNSDTYLIEKLEYTDLNNNTSSFKIEKLDTVSELSDSLFTYEIPPGSEVIDLR